MDTSRRFFSTGLPKRFLAHISERLCNVALTQKKNAESRPTLPDAHLPLGRVRLRRTQISPHAIR
jgi:hypothetical protein